MPRDLRPLQCVMARDGRGLRSGHAARGPLLERDEQHRLDPQGQAYYQVTPAQRWITGIAYIVLAALLTLGMSGTFVERDL